eukprot:TRINITY_DN8481_c0_g1_i7.p1 TRINITY_DN8481_c0_g1~~TRINITY_DN8481_c0_g1_i7.p1  ORF type:complete len:215 (+),score=35.01 TRINITY_DN8481_c0_g1_i7:269-913(+)
MRGSLELKTFIKNRLVVVSLGTVVIRLYWEHLPNNKAFLDRFVNIVLRLARENQDQIEIYFPCLETMTGCLEGKDVPGNFHPYYEFLPLLKVLPLIDTLITHGGANSVIESLFVGVPLIVVPFFGDQVTNAKWVVECGVGFSFLFDPDWVFRFPDLNSERKSLTFETFSHAVELALNDSEIRKQCDEFSKSLRKVRAADVVNAILVWLNSHRGL